MKTATSFLLTNNEERVIKNSIIMLGLKDKEYKNSDSSNSFIEFTIHLIEDTISKHKDIEWFIFDAQLESDSQENMLMFNAYLPLYLHNKYPNLKFIHITKGSVFGNDNWNNSSEIDKHSPENYFSKSISIGEQKSDRTWNLRFDVFDDELLNREFSEGKVYYGEIDKKYSLITNNAANKIIEGIIDNHAELKADTYHIIPNNTQTEYELLHYIAWSKNAKGYIERSSSIVPINNVLKTCKKRELSKIWDFAGYPEIPNFKELFDEITQELV
jgi:dTDP-4-dehydrorhamnose reductase